MWFHFLAWNKQYRTETHYCVCKCGSDLGSVQADDAVDVACAVVEVRHGDGVLAGGDPVLFGVGVDLEDVGSGAEDGLLSGETKPKAQLLKPVIR